MQALIIAGGTIKADKPLFIETGISKKALLPIGGKPMIQWVAEALMGSKYIDGLVIVGLKPDSFDHANIPVRYVADQGNIIDNGLAGMTAIEEIEPDYKKFIVCSSDIPLLTPALVDEFVETFRQQEYADVYYPLVEEKVMEARFPGSRRTFTPMKGGRYAGGDIFFADRGVAKANQEFLRGLTGQRKNFFAQARMIGFVFIFKFIFRMMDIHEAAARASKVAGATGRALEYPRAEVAMDVDKLHQYLLVKEILEAKQA
jgi:molybdopterin-guanine dinucleotide biosynthesis protein A